jgi:hypothetical protein
MKSKIISVVLCLGVVLALMLVPAAQQALATSPEWGYETQPNITKVGFNEDFNVTVSAVCYAGNADTWNIMVDFDQTYLQVIGITRPATLPTGDAPDPFPGAPTLNNTAGWVFDGYGTPFARPTVNVTFAAWTIHFRSNNVTTGSTYLNFVTVDPSFSTMAILAGGDYLNWTRVVNGTVMIGTPQLTVNVTPAGKGTVKANGVTLTGYPNTTTRSWDALVSLEAVNSTPGYGFVSWAGNLTGSTNPTSITMNATAKNVTANFAELPPKISPVPTSLTFNGNVGGNVTNKTLDIYNGGGGILNWTANITGVNATWLSMSPMSGGNLAAAQFNATKVAVNTTGLTAGTYHANITISGAVSDAPEGAESAVGKFVITAVTVPVTLNLGVPEISASPTPLTFTTNEGENPADKTLEVCNSGTGTLNWSLTDNAAWLSETPTSGSLDADDCEDVTVSVAASGLAAGDYSATITIIDPLANNTPQTVSVSLSIVSTGAGIPGAPGGIAPPAAPASLSASGLHISPHQVKPGQEVTISINVANSGGETGSYNAVLYINGAVEDSQLVSLAGGMTKNVIFMVSKSDAGVYDVSIAGQSGQFEVVHTGWFGGGLGTGGIIVIVVIVIVLILALVFVLRGTRRAV